ncbi:MAG: radical SAM protein [SAR202 cluster bacterium]|nr:radical SAM protein [SAR202 cluster bacterium]|tara:strand:+ start:1895 stop:3199 length:1305 start_codon:yes stop_codon:yes gene_type:complete
MNTIFTQHLKSKYVDIVYNLTSPKVCDIKVKELSSEHEETFRVTYGSPRTISYETPSVGILKLEIMKPKDAQIEIVSIVNRSQQGDFLNLSESNLVDKNNYDKNKSKVSESMLDAKPHIQWFLTWKCNYKCQYCWQEAANEIYRNTKNNKLTPELWAESFNKLNPKEIYFTGGEPTLYKGLVDVIKMLNPEIELRMTTNFGKTFNLDKWSELPPNRVDVDASLHPTQVNVDDFIRKVADYTEKYGSEKFGIELVRHPDNLKIVNEAGLIDFCKDRGITLNLDEYVSVFEEEDQDGMELDLYKQIVDIKPLSPLDFGPLCEPVEIPLDCSLKLEPCTDKARLPIFCPAGSMRINVDGFGDAYTCMSAVDRSKMFGRHALPHYKPVGNILDDNFSLMSEPVVCWESFRCSACDSCFVSKFWEPMDEQFNMQLPICE